VGRGVVGVWAVLQLCVMYPDICLKTEEKKQKNFRDSIQKVIS